MSRVVCLLVACLVALAVPAGAFADEPAFSLVKAEALVEGGGYENIAARASIAPRDPEGVDPGQLSGEVVGAFDLALDGSGRETELVVSVGPSAAASDDVLALYRREDASATTSTWHIAAYAEVVGGTFTFEASQPGMYAVVNKSHGSAPTTPLPASAGEGANENSLRNALATPGVHVATGVLAIPECYVNTTPLGHSEFRDTTIAGSNAASVITLVGGKGTADVHLYFENCTFDGESLKIAHAGTYVFNRCTFANSPQTSITLAAEGVDLYVFNSTLRDNNPSRDEFNANAGSVRSYKYAALSAQADNCSMHVNRTAIEGYQANPTVLVSKDYSGGGGRNREGVALYFENSTMRRCGGCGIYLASSTRGRIASSEFAEIGALRGKDGYATTYVSRWGGYGVGGNAVYTNQPCYNMRVTGNDISNVMENGIEGFYWCVEGNEIANTGYRYDEGYVTVSTEGIWGGSAFVRNNRIISAHGHGIVVQDWDGHFDVEVSGNYIAKSPTGLQEDKEGIRVIEGDGRNTVSVHDNEVCGFTSPYGPVRIIYGDRAHAGAIRVDAATNIDVTSTDGYLYDVAPPSNPQPASEGHPFDGTGIVASVQGVTVRAASLGIGGGGALFDPAISPFDSRHFITGCDMGSAYVTLDGGESWERHVLTGCIEAVAYDPVRPGVVYAGGSGLSRSTDDGHTWELIWPKPSTITSEPVKREQSRHYLFNSDTWNPTASIRSIAVDERDPARVYALCWEWPDAWVLYGSADDGTTFKKIGSVGRDLRGVSETYDATRVIVAEGVPYVCTQTGVYKPVAGDGALQPVYQPSGAYRCIIDVVRMPAGDRLFAVAEGTREPLTEAGARPASASASPYATSLRTTKDWAVFTDYTDEMNANTAAFSRTAGAGWLAGTAGFGKAFDLCITGMAASGERLYFNVDSPIDGNYDAFGAVGLLDFGKGEGERFRWVYGTPFEGVELNGESVTTMFDHADIKERGHIDSYHAHWGLACDARNPRAFLLDTGGGAFWTDDCDYREPDGAWPPNRSSIKQLYTRAASGSDGGPTTFATTGIDELTSYGLRQDPFNENRLAILYTDSGLYVSEDGGASWGCAQNPSELPGWTNTCYDLEYDRFLPDVAYSVWSDAHDKPYYTNADGDSWARGGFATSDSGGWHWTPAKSGAESNAEWKSGDAGLPPYIIPVALDVVYPQGASAAEPGGMRTIWVGAFNRGVFRSTDSGRTFEQLNDGLATVDDHVFCGDIVASEDGEHVFALVSRPSHLGAEYTEEAVGRVYEWEGAHGTWRELSLPDGVRADCPRSLFWDEAASTLYVAYAASHEFIERADAAQPDFRNFGGGVYSYTPQPDAGVGAGAARAAGTGAGSLVAASAPGRSGEARALVPVDASSALIGDAGTVEGAVADADGNLFVSDREGSVWLRRAGADAFEKLYDRFHLPSKGVQLFSQAVEGARRTDALVVPTFGGGLLRLDVTLDARQAPGSDDGKDPGEDPNSPAAPRQPGNSGDSGSPDGSQVPLVPGDAQAPGSSDAPADPSGPAGEPGAGPSDNPSSPDLPDVVQPSDPASPQAGQPSSPKPPVSRAVFQVTNPKTHDHRYLVSFKKAKNLACGKWVLEGIAFLAPAKSSRPVYRLVNKATKRNLYTTAKRKAGWVNKGRAFYAMDSGGVKVYRLKYKKTGAYVLSKKPAEVKRLKKRGWRSRVIAFRAVA